MTIGESVTSNNNSRDSRPESALRSGLASLITIVALAWAMGLFQAFEIVQTNRSETHSVGQDNA